jgi:hypothetical protein
MYFHLALPVFFLKKKKRNQRRKKNKKLDHPSQSRAISSLHSPALTPKEFGLLANGTARCTFDPFGLRTFLVEN